MSSHIQPLPHTIETYNSLMEQVRKGKVHLNMSNADIGKAMNRSRLNAIHLLSSDNISLKNFISLANAIGLKLVLIEHDQ